MPMRPPIDNLLQSLTQPYGGLHGHQLWLCGRHSLIILGVLYAAARLRELEKRIKSIEDPLQQVLAHNVSTVAQSEKDREWLVRAQKERLAEKEELREWREERDRFSERLLSNEALLQENLALRAFVTSLRSCLSRMCTLSTAACRHFGHTRTQNQTHTRTLTCASAGSARVDEMEAKDKMATAAGRQLLVSDYHADQDKAPPVKVELQTNELTIDVNAAKETSLGSLGLWSESGAGSVSSSGTRSSAKPSCSSPTGFGILSPGKSKRAYRVSFGDGIVCPACIAGGGGDRESPQDGRDAWEQVQQVLDQHHVLKQANQNLKAQVETATEAQAERQARIEKEYMGLRDKVETLLELRENREREDSGNEERARVREEAAKCALAVQSTETNKLQSAVDGLRAEIAKHCQKMCQLSEEQQVVDDKLQGLHADASTHVRRLESQENRLAFLEHEMRLALLHHVASLTEGRVPAARPEMTPERPEAIQQGEERECTQVQGEQDCASPDEHGQTSVLTLRELKHEMHGIMADVRALLEEVQCRQQEDKETLPEGERVQALSMEENEALLERRLLVLAYILHPTCTVANHTFTYFEIGARYAERDENRRQRSQEWIVQLAPPWAHILVDLKTKTDSACTQKLDGDAHKYV